MKKIVIGLVVVMSVLGISVYSKKISEEKQVQNQELLKAKAVVLEQKKQEMLRRAMDESKALHDRYVAIINFEKDFPKEAEEYKEIFEKIKSKSRDEHLKQEAKRKKSEGVRVGMSMEDVLASSWGTPTRKNISTSSRGTREQWVYGNGNYLYFEDGKLSSIQTSR